MPSLQRPVNKTFESERLFYRAIETGDNERFYEIISEPGCIELGDAMIPCPPSRKRWDKSVGTFQEQSLLFVFICLRENSEDGHAKAGKPIGCIYLSKPSLVAKAGHRSTEFAIWLSEDYRSKGYGTEATKWTMDWAFNYAGVHRIHLESSSYNEAALALWERVGFTLEGRQREKVWYQRRWFDSMLYSILEQEWEAGVKQKN